MESVNLLHHVAECMLRLYLAHADRQPCPWLEQGSKLVRWAAVEAISKNHGGDKIKADYRRIAERRGRNIGRVAAARRVLTLVYYGLRDGEIRCLAPSAAG